MTTGALEARLLGWQERARLMPLLAELAERFAEPEAFEPWCRGVLTGLVSGEFTFAALEREGELEGGLLAQAAGDARTVVAALGAPAVDGARSALAALKADARLVAWDENIGAGWVAALAEAGESTFQRQSLLQALERVAFPPPPELAGAIAAWRDADAEEVLSAMAQHLAHGLEGAFLTLPAYPDAAACRSELAGALSGSHGAFLPWASFVARERGELLGGLLCVQGEHSRRGLLFELLVLPAARGRQLSRRLVQSMQRALLAAGYSELEFHTTAENAPVQHLFRDEELVERTSSRGGYWLKP